jgi:hypothetical protein
MGLGNLHLIYSYITHLLNLNDYKLNINIGFGAANPTQACSNPNGLNPNVTVGRKSVGIAAPGDSGP